MRFEMAPVVVGDEARKPALKRRQPGNMGTPVGGQQPVDHRHRRLALRLTIQFRHTVRHPQHLGWRTGQKRIARQMFLAQHALQKDELCFAFQPRRQPRGLPVNDFAHLRRGVSVVLHGASI